MVFFLSYIEGSICLDRASKSILPSILPLLCLLISSVSCWTGFLYSCWTLFPFVCTYCIFSDWLLMYWTLPLGKAGGGGRMFAILLSFGCYGNQDLPRPLIKVDLLFMNNNEINVIFFTCFSADPICIFSGCWSLQCGWLQWFT